MGVDSLIKVFVLLDQLFNIVRLRLLRVVGLVCGREEGLACRHPALGLFAVAVEELKLEVLVQLHASVHPCPAEDKHVLIQHQKDDTRCRPKKNYHFFHLGTMFVVDVA